MKLVSSDADEKQRKGWSLNQLAFDKIPSNPSERRFGVGPETQTMGGKPWGIRFVAKSNEDDYMCPQFDSAGLRVIDT
jgi:hypothetical protein